MNKETQTQNVTVVVFRVTYFICETNSDFEVVPVLCLVSVVFMLLNPRRRAD